MRYRDFIQEIQQLAAAGDELLAPGTTHETPAFRAWRHRIESLVAEAKALGWRLPGEFRSHARNYRETFHPATDNDHFRAFSRDVGDTLIQARYLIDQYQKYGEPKSVQIIGADSSIPEAPATVTFAWLWKHVSVGFWGKVAAILLGAFLIGVAVGRTNTYQAFESWIKEVSSSGHANGA